MRNIKLGTILSLIILDTEAQALILVNQWNPFKSDKGYLFIGENAKKQKITIFVDPTTGKLIEIN
ncbi:MULTISPECIES: hypothetical protein [Cytobacillus]|uniref:hypothetical protein n=1 Tax=Cytobacillus TaxID=2675230 RepID=UPI00203E9664|nr:hypothetical protein [Cytobacillus firmus]MCM3704703.1 hypothetical protein [Cytobacillus firmus]